MTSISKFSFLTLQKILDDLNKNGEYEITVLTDLNGFPIASSSRKMDDMEIQAAVVSQLQKLILQMGNYLGMGLSDEISFNDVDGKKLVCRSFHLNGSEFILAILISGRTKTYRRLTNQAISHLQRMMSG